MNEYQIIEKLGWATSPEIKELLDKSIQATIRQLNSLEITGQIEVIIFHTKKYRRRVYVKKEIFDNLCKIA